MAQRNADIRGDDELLEDVGPLTEEEMRELENMVLVDEDEVLEGGEAAPDAARHEVPASDNERPAPDVSQEATSEQGLRGPNITTRSEEQRGRDPAVQEQDIVRDTEMSDAHNLQDEERTQAGRESSKITTSSAAARITVDRPRKRATVPGVQGGQMSPIFKPPPQGPVNKADRTPSMVGPETSQCSVSEDADAQRVANWRARGLAPLPVTSDEMEDIEYLRRCNMEFALLSNNKYMPPGMRVNDTMRLFVARNYGWLCSNNLMQRTVTAEVLLLKKELKAGYSRNSHAETSKCIHT